MTFRKCAAPKPGELAIDAPSHNIHSPAYGPLLEPTYVHWMKQERARSDPRVGVVAQAIRTNLVLGATHKGAEVKEIGEDPEAQSYRLLLGTLALSRMFRTPELELRPHVPGRLIIAVDMKKWGDPSVRIAAPFVNAGLGTEATPHDQWYADENGLYVHRINPAEAPDDGGVYEVVGPEFTTLMPYLAHVPNMSARPVV